MVDMEEIECNIDEDIDNEHYSDKNINNTFINKLKDFSTFNPSGKKGLEKNNSMLVAPQYNSLIPIPDRSVRIDQT